MSAKMKLTYDTKAYDYPRQLNDFFRIRRGYHKYSALFLYLLFLLNLPLVGIGVLWLLTVIKNFPLIESNKAGLIILACSGIFAFAILRELFARYKNRTISTNLYNVALDDYAWNTTGYIPDRWFFARRGLLRSLLFCVFPAILIFGTVKTWKSGGFDFWMILFSVCTIIITPSICFATAKLISRAIKFGKSRIIFDSFPYSRNEAIIIKWVSPKGLDESSAGSFTLRCIWEDYTMVGKSEHITYNEWWYGAWRLNEPHIFQAGEIHSFCYELSTYPRTSKLNSDKPTYWEFEVKLKTAGIDFKETYLVPIY